MLCFVAENRPRRVQSSPSVVRISPRHDEQFTAPVRKDASRSIVDPEKPKLRPQRGAVEAEEFGRGRAVAAGVGERLLEE